jgi:NTE family protein
MVAVVMPGGGSRGAYEAGALSVILPAIEARGERVAVWCGTSVGAINAATSASLAHLPAEEAAKGLAERWRSIRKGDVIRSSLGPRLPLTIGRLGAELLGVPGARTASVLDAAPLRTSLDRWVDWDALRRNVRGGQVDAVCVVATSLDAGWPVAFVQTGGRAQLPSSPRLRYVRANGG